MQIRYRSDIDGLRALAIIFVLLFHGNVNIFPSGFIGVDIFFVISGFLISSIVKNAIDNDKFSFCEFYRRRMWRLQPPLLALIVFTLVFAIIFYLPKDFIDFVISEKYTTLLLSNQYFSRATTGYAVQDANFLLLLHTWSLAIEWQWYLIFPVTFYFLHKIKNKNAIIFILVMLTISAFLIALWSSYYDENKSYYFLISRIFEFMTGATLSLISLPKNNKKNNIYIINILSLLALVTLFHIASYKNILAGYPNYYALIVCTSTAILIYTGSQGGLVYQLLSLRPFVYIGRLSYSLYLWHWPIFATARYIGVFNDIKVKAICYILTILFSFISYKYIEKPLRKQKIPFFKSLLILIILPIILSLAIDNISDKYKGFNFRFGEEHARIDNILTQYSANNRTKCFNKENDIADKRCEIGKISSTRKALLIGDSNANHFWNFFDVIGKKYDTSVTSITSSSCLALPKIRQYHWGNNSINTSCEKNTINYFNSIATSKFNFVIIAERWSNYLGFIVMPEDKKNSGDKPQNIIFHALDDAISFIEKSGSKVVLMKEIPRARYDYLDCFYTRFKNRIFHPENKIDNCNFDINETNKRINNTLWVEEMFQKIQIKHPSVVIINPTDLLCHGGKCLGNIKGVPTYRDDGHLTDYASYQLGVKYAKEIGDPFQ